MPDPKLGLDTLLTGKVVAAQLSVTESYLKKLRQADLGPPAINLALPGRRPVWRYDPTALADWRAAQRAEAYQRHRHVSLEWSNWRAEVNRQWLRWPDAFIERVLELIYFDQTMSPESRVIMREISLLDQTHRPDTLHFHPEHRDDARRLDDLSPVERELMLLRKERQRRIAMRHYPGAGRENWSASFHARWIAMTLLDRCIMAVETRMRHDHHEFGDQCDQEETKEYLTRLRCELEQLQGVK